MYGKCKLCGYEDDKDYLRIMYSGHPGWNKIAYLCEKCHDKIFSDRERLNPEDRNDMERHKNNSA